MAGDTRDLSRVLMNDVPLQMLPQSPTPSHFSRITESSPDQHQKGIFQASTRHHPGFEALGMVRNLSLQPRSTYEIHSQLQRWANLSRPCTITF